jgi:prepilin-type N-terminal cleavage/methylation domain-containing protein
MAINKGQRGFSLVELLVATAIIAIVIMMSSNLFTVVIAQSGQQAKVAGSGMDSIIGLNILRYDIEHAGYGLPDGFQGSINYLEAASSPASTYNDSPASVPRGIFTGTAGTLNSSDYLVIKSTVVGTSETAQKWTYIVQGSPPKIWDTAKLRLSDGDRVIVIRVPPEPNAPNQLVMDDSNNDFYTRYDSDTFPTKFSPAQPGEKFVIYGVDIPNNTDGLRMPFNRVDYYVSIQHAGDIPPSCAPHTGILYRATIKHSDGSLDENRTPILDCVADMQVVFRRDTNLDGTVDTISENISGLTAQQIRETVKEVRVYILAQEGQRDPSYTHTPSSVLVGENIGGNDYGSNFNLATTIGTGWQNYRWKLYTMVVRPRQHSR